MKDEKIMKALSLIEENWKEESGVDPELESTLKEMRDIAGRISEQHLMGQNVRKSL
jgi:hypothetical protein